MAATDNIGGRKVMSIPRLVLESGDLKSKYNLMEKENIVIFNIAACDLLGVLKQKLWVCKYFLDSYCYSITHTERYIMLISDMSYFV